MLNTKCVVDVKSCDPGTVIGYQVVWEGIWLLFQCYPGIVGRVFTLAHFNLEPGYEDYTSLN